MEGGGSVSTGIGDQKLHGEGRGDGGGGGAQKVGVLPGTRSWSNGLTWSQSTPSFICSPGPGAPPSPWSHLVSELLLAHCRLGELLLHVAVELQGRGVGGEEGGVRVPLFQQQADTPSSLGFTPRLLLPVGGI